MSTLTHRRSSIQYVSGGNLAPAPSYVVQVLPVGAQVVSVNTGTNTITVRAGHGIAAGDKFIVVAGSSMRTDSFRAVSGTPGATTVVYTGADITDLATDDFLVNLGPDAGTTTPLYTASTVAIYTDMAGAGTAVTNSTVTTNAQGEFDYWTSTKAVWELVRNGSGAVVELWTDPMSVGGEITVTLGNVIKFEGATDDAYETTLTATDPTADRTVTLPNSTGTVALTSDLTPYMPLAGGVITGDSSFGNAATDVFTCVGRLVIRSVAADPSGTPTAGTLGELVRLAGATPTIYVKTTADGTDTNWAKVGAQ